MTFPASFFMFFTSFFILQIYYSTYNIYCRHFYKLFYNDNKKSPGLSRGHPKNYDKNMKTPTNRIRKLLAYLYYTKKSRPDTSLSGVLCYLFFVIFDSDFYFLRHIFLLFNFSSDCICSRLGLFFSSIDCFLNFS